MQKRCIAMFALLVCMTWGTAVYANAPYGFYMNEYVKPWAELHVRAGVGTSYTSYGTVQPGNPGEVIGGPTYNDGYYWWRVDYPIQGLTGWCAQDWLTLWDERDEESFSSGYVMISYIDGTPLNVRSGASVDYSVIDSYPEGTVGEVVGGPTHNDAYVWWHIEWPDGTDGWSVQRYLEESAPPPPPADTTPPVITRIGNSTVEVAYGANYTDAGATAWDENDGDITSDIVTTGLPIDTTDVGDHYVWYNVSDAAGNDAQAKARIVRVPEEEEPPPPPPTEGDAVVFGNTLGSGWFDQSLNATYTVNEGHLEATFDAYGELRFSTDTFDTSGYNLLSFYVRPKSMNEQLYVHVYDEYGNMSWTYHLYVPNYSIGGQLYPGVWQEIHVPLEDLNADNRIITGVAFQIDYAQTLEFDEIRINLHTENGGECNEN